MEKMLKMINEPQGSICRRVLEDNRKLFQTARGSRHNHQAWKGGYFDHVRDAMNIGIVLYVALSVQRPLTFSLSDVLLVIFWHDVEKPWKYELVKGKLEPIEALKSKDAQHAFREKKMKEYGIRLNARQKNGLRCVEGRDADYDPNKRIMKPLAALCHMADIWSARGWFNFPKRKNDPWKGAKRCLA